MSARENEYRFMIASLAVLVRGVKDCVNMRDIEIRSMQAAVSLFSLFILANSATYAVIAYSPANVYFWFLAGMMLKLPSLASSEDG